MRTKQRDFWIASFVSIWIAIILSTRAEDWPRFLGPRGDGTSSETNLLDALPADGPKVLWDAKIGAGYSAPSIRAGRLVLFHRVGKEEVVEALNIKEPKSEWRYAYATDYIDPYGYNNGPRCTPLLTEKFCFTFGAEGKLLCLDVNTGKKIWENDTAQNWKIPQAFFGVGSTPLLEGTTLIVMVGGQTNSGMVGFEADTGKVKWESVGARNWNGLPMTGWRGERTVEWNEYNPAYQKQASYATPVAATVNGARQIFCLMRQGLVSINPTNGAVNFSFWFRSEMNDSVNASCPIIVGNKVFISAAYYKIGSVLLEVAPDNKSVKEVWRGTALEMHWSTPILKDGYLFGFSGRNEPDAWFRCVEYATGKVMWERDERWVGHQKTAPTFGRGSAILADGKLIALGEGGFLGIFKPNPQKCEEVSRWQVPSLHYPCWAAPVLSDRKLYLRSEDRLVCIDFAKP
jgi:outer membrane protein assembly factor BamB